MDTKTGIVNNFSGLEVHAINAINFEQQPIDLRNLQRAVEGHCFPTLPITSQALQSGHKAILGPNVIVYDKPEYVRNVDKHIEVLKSAKSLFSKRTLTLYHWIYPTIPKQQLKVNVAAAWENLPIAEKHFYISQVLGKFGYPQTSLMLNPQLQNLSSVSPALFADTTQTTSTNKAVHVQQSSNLFTPFNNTSNLLLKKQQENRTTTSGRVLKKAYATRNDMGKGSLILAGSQLLNAADCTRSLLIPQQQDRSINLSKYEQAEVVELLNNKIEEGETAMYEIRLDNGVNGCVVNERMAQMMGPRSNLIGNSNAVGIVDEDSLNHFMEKMLVPPSMEIFVQNATFPPRLTTRNKSIYKRRGRPPALKRKPTKKDTQKHYITIEVEDEFRDDPELREELQQFENALHMQL